MSQTATAVSVKDVLVTALEQAAEKYFKDLSFIPSDKIASVPMGVARTPLEFTAECAGFNKMVAATLRGEEMPKMAPEDRSAYYASMNTVDKVRDALQASVADLVDAINGLDDAGLTAELPAYWGGTIPAHRLALIAAEHISYHDGQLNYIQSLYGDDANHWGD